MIEYTEIPELPGRPAFRCERLHAVLQVTSCAAQWRKAQADPESVSSCRSCAVGAQHAGESETVSVSKWRGVRICARCRRGTTKLVRKHLCVSCANRVYERERGKNARGVPPSRLAPLDARRLSLFANGQVTELRLVSQDAIELFVAALRDSEQRVQFGFCAKPIGGRRHGSV